MAKVKTRAHDAANYIETDEDAVLLLEAAPERRRSWRDRRSHRRHCSIQGMSEVAQATGLSRESLYRALSANGNPTLSTTLQVLKALGLRLTVAEDAA